MATVGLGIALALSFGALLAVTMRPSFVTRCAKAPRDIASICAGVDRYMLANGGRCPDALAQLITPDANGDWYLKDRTVMPVDSWGHPYGYEPASERGGYRVFTLGRDGKPGGSGDDADIDNFTIASER